MATGGFCQSVIDTATERADKPAMTLLGSDLTEPIRAETTTFGEMLSRIRSVAYRLAQEQIDFGDRVALIGENHPNWVVAYLGVLLRGAVATPLDQSSTVETMAHFIDASEAKLAFVAPASIEKFRSVCERLGRPIPFVTLFDGANVNGFARFEDWARTPRPPEFDAAAPPACPTDLAVLMYTSGTTGAPKAVPLTHGNIFAESEGVRKALHVTDSEVVLSLLPLFHAYSQVVNLWLATTIGARVVYVTELGSAGIERGLREGGATALVGVPRLWYLFHKKIFDGVGRRPLAARLFRSLLAVNGLLRDRLGVNAGPLLFKRIHDSFGGRLRLAVSAGASFDARVAWDFHRLGFTILQGYGLSETAGAATITRFEDNVVGSVGAPIGGVEIEIDRPDERGVGEVLIRGPVVMRGYYRNPEANREAFTEDGWFRSGDLGRLDAAGRLYVIGRKKDVIKLPTGKQIFPEDVEAHYSRSRLVGEVCVLGVRDPSGGFERAEKLLAVVVPDFGYLKSHHIANAREAIRFELDNLGRELPEYQRARDYLIRVEPLPRTTTRKIKRFELKNQIEGSGEIAGAGRRTDRFVFSRSDRELVDSEIGRAVVAAIKQQSSEATAVHPQMNLELDLGLDSLARAECMVGVERALDVQFSTEAEAAALTVADLITLAQSVPRGGRAAGQNDPQPEWREILAGGSPADSDLRPVLKRKPVTVAVAFGLLRLVYLVARVLLRLEVEGREVLTRLPRPVLICPNHQSYLDAILLCSTYPRDLLSQVFHVGAREYFTGPFMRRIAHAFNILPLDPDAHLLGAMRASAGGLRAGKALNLYPEGQRSFDGGLQEFKNGAAILATELELPVVPVAIDGMYRVWPRNSWRIRPAKVKIRFGEPFTPRAILPAGVGGEAAYDAVTEELKGRIRRMLDEMRRAGRARDSHGNGALKQVAPGTRNG
jgi:long-chain acyl-CoA synthetase